MDVTQALRQRRSVRAFLPDAPPAALVQTLLKRLPRPRPAAICSPGALWR